MKKGCLIALMVVLLASNVVAGDKYAERITKATEVYRELLDMPDREVPETLLKHARCIVVIPGMIKAAMAWGGQHGRGVASCRNDAGEWSPPSFINTSGGSFGFQIGVDRTDLVLFIMGRKGAESLIESEFTLGAGAAVVAGPVGRSAEGATDIKLDAEIYSYAKAKGLFAGVALTGARVNSADKAIEGYYGKPLHPKTILFDHNVPKLPDEARQFIDVLP